MSISRYVRDRRQPPVSQRRRRRSAVEAMEMTQPQPRCWLRWPVTS